MSCILRQGSLSVPNRKDHCSRKGAGLSERESCRPQAMLHSRGLTNTSPEAPPISAYRLPSSQSRHGHGGRLASLTRNLWLAPGDPRVMCWKFNVCFLFLSSVTALRILVGRSSHDKLYPRSSKGASSARAPSCAIIVRLPLWFTRGRQCYS